MTKRFQELSRRRKSAALSMNAGGALPRKDAGVNNTLLDEEKKGGENYCLNEWF